MFTVPPAKEVDSVTCVTPHGQGFSIILIFGAISVKYSYNDKNLYHHEVSDILGE